MDIVETLLASDSPSIRYKTRLHVLGEDPATLETLKADIAGSAEATGLLQRQDADGAIHVFRNAYDKWQGTHWVMAALADIDYPSGDKRLELLRDQLQREWLAPNYYTEFEAKSRSSVYRKPGVPVMEGRHRRCASQQANALWSILKLGLADERTHDFVERLLHWQWPDGGWNCDKNPNAHHSSFMESILPLRALALYADVYNHAESRSAADRAAEIFLKRHLYLRQADGQPIKQEFLYLHYPLYWHYDVLHGLKVLSESGYIDDPRCDPALDWLMDKQLPDGGWPAEKRYFRTDSEPKPGNDYLDWGGTGKRKMNRWVTVDALTVLKAAGRL